MRRADEGKVVLDAKSAAGSRTAGRTQGQKGKVETDDGR